MPCRSICLAYKRLVQSWVDELLRTITVKQEKYVSYAGTVYAHWFTISVLAASGVKKLGGQEIAPKISDRQSCEFSIVSGNFNVIPKFLKNAGFSPEFCILDKDFPTRRKFSDSPKFRGGGGNCPLTPWIRPPLPRSHWASLRDDAVNCHVIATTAAATAAAASDVTIRVWRMTMIDLESSQRRTNRRRAFFKSILN